MWHFYLYNNSHWIMPLSHDLITYHRSMLRQYRRVILLGALLVQKRKNGIT